MKNTPVNQSLQSRISRAYRSILLLLVAVVLASCGGSSEDTNAPIRLIGIDLVSNEDGSCPSTFTLGNWFVESPFQRRIGITGGSGTYKVRYLTESPEDLPCASPETTNHVDMDIRREVGREDQFIIVGTPTFPDGADSIEGNLDLIYFIEIDDGSQTVVFRFEALLNENSLSFTTGVFSLNEGFRGSTNDADRLFDLANVIDANPLAEQSVCEEVRQGPIDPITQIDGRDAYLFYEAILLDGPPAGRTELTYRLTSEYSEAVGEGLEGNIGVARPGVDYYDVTRTVVLEAGENNCVVKVALFPDFLVEGTESFTLEFVSVTGSHVSISEGVLSGQIVDLSPSVLYEPETVVVNRGGQYVQAFEGTLLVGQEYDVNFGLDNIETTAAESQFSLFPQSNVLQFSEDSALPSISIAINEFDLEDDPGLDKRVVLSTNIDHFLDTNDRTEVVINEWAASGSLDDEIIAREAEGDEVVKIEVDDNGIIYSLSESLSPSGDRVATLSARNRNGSVFALTDTSATIEYALNGVNVTPVGLSTTFETSNSQLAVLLKVDGFFINQAYGGDDFVVAMYETSESGLNSIGTDQFGSLEDDEPLGLEFNENLDLIVFGSTSGDTLSGSPGVVINSGGRDGFAYSLSAVESNILVGWSRFIGSALDDELLALDVGRSDFIALFQSGSVGTDLRVLTGTVSSGEDVEVDAEDEVRFTSSRTSQANSIIYSDAQSRFYFGGSSDALLTEDDLTDSGTEDVLVGEVLSGGGSGPTFRFATSGVDTLSGLEILPDRDRLAVVGQTTGALVGQNSFGLQDAMFGLVQLGEATGITALTQFGSPGVDTVIDVASVGSDKFLVLWSEDFTSGDGSLVYRISVFTPDGLKLSANPQ